MKIVFRTESLKDALEKISRISKMEFACMKIQDKDIYIYGGDSTKYVKLHVDSKILSKSKVKGFSFNIRTLQRLTKQGNTDKVTVEVKGEKLLFFRSDKDSKIRGEFQIMMNMDKEQELDKKNSIELSRSHIQAISKSIKHVNIKSLHTTTLDLPLNVVFNKQGMHMFISDGYHYAYVLDKKATSKKETKFDMPAAIYSNIEYISNGEKFRVNISDSHIHAYGLGFEASFLILQHMRSDKIVLSDLVDKTKEMFPTKTTNKKFRRVNILLDRLSQSVENLGVISEGSNIIQFKPSNKNLMLSVRSQLGKISELTNLQIKNWKDDDIYLINEVLLKDVLNLYPNKKGNITLYFKGGKSSSMSTSYKTKDLEAVYVCALLMDG